ncbi:hypothetical protein MPL3356_230157 [Mesorhizobium plurifarium]|uniref:Uncharacterized protein n=1 Tax=Mesorhizobium plurifarium TaxID=69974 RepID=A0A090DS85_MESPL|nr:hypothetical protein MPL3356_230157 [Mesorhizobium plurifarium]CDX56834.1 hypothetical protein MPL3365_250019 [Mesorhizobium plurifarium]
MWHAVRCATCPERTVGFVRKHRNRASFSCTYPYTIARYTCRWLIITIESMSDYDCKTGTYVQKDGAPGRDRTRDLRFTKPLLYQLSYKGTALR